MSVLFFLYRTVLKNRIRRALRMPITYFYIALAVFYAFIIPFSLKVLVTEYRMDSPGGMTAVLTVFAFWVVPGNLIAYAKRKGLIYRNSDVHFLFTAPVSPKKILLYAYMKTLAMEILLNLFVAVLGGILFRIAWWRTAVYFLFSLLVQNFLEGGIMLILYGNERLSEKSRRLVVKAAYALVGIFVLFGLYVYNTRGLSLESVLYFLHNRQMQLVPVIGWYIAVIHLIFMGPEAANLAAVAAYGIFLAVIVFAALRMRCTGAYYEDAIKFAEDYEELQESRRQGRTDKRLGKKERFKKASVAYRGSGAKALFYRQLLEYRKNRFFIFDVSTFMSLAAGVAIAYIYVSQGGVGELTPFMIPGVTAYLIFVFTSLSTKWSRELLSPYTYLIPDTAFRKLWYATAMQHIQAIINGVLITLPGAVVMKLSPLTAVLCIAFYVVLNANKLYALAVAEALVGDNLGRVAKQLLQLLLQGVVIDFAFLGALAGMLISGIDMAYVMMIAFLTLATALFMLAATLNFYRMETA